MAKSIVKKDENCRDIMTWWKNLKRWRNHGENWEIPISWDRTPGDLHTSEVYRCASERAMFQTSVPSWIGSLWFPWHRAGFPPYIPLLWFYFQSYVCEITLFYIVLLFTDMLTTELETKHLAFHNGSASDDGWSQHVSSVFRFDQMVLSNKWRPRGFRINPSHIIWLVVSNIFYFPYYIYIIYGMSSFPLANSYFSRWLKPPTSQLSAPQRWPFKETSSP
jgi:hypothetical protein